jgi:orotate phosphoribosyltransferase
MAAAQRIKQPGTDMASAQQAARSASLAAKADRLRAIIAEKSLIIGREFTLASGRKSDFFLDLKKTMLDPEGMDLLSDLVLDRIAAIDADYIGGLAMGAVPIVIGTIIKSQATARPRKGFWVRKDRKDHGNNNLTDGYIEENARVIIVEDVTTTGGSALLAIEEVKKRHCAIATVLTIVDRQEGAQENLAQRGIALTSLFTRSDFLQKR